MRKEAAAQADADCVEVEDEEDDIMVPAVAAQVSQGIMAMASSFEQLQKEADAALEELRRPKRPRTEAHGFSVPVPTSPTAAQEAPQALPGGAGVTVGPFQRANK